MADLLDCDPADSERITSACQAYIDVAVDHMATAIRSITVGKGHAVTDAALVAYGGAAGQFACDVAERLGVQRVLVPANASLLSALGIAMSPRQVCINRTVELPLDLASHQTCQDLLIDVEREALQELETSAEEAAIVCEVEVRTASNLTFWVAWSSAQDIKTDFRRQVRELCKFDLPEEQLFIASLRVIAEHKRQIPLPQMAFASTPQLEPRKVWVGDAMTQVEVTSCAEVSQLIGPAVLVDTHTSIYVPPGWQAVKGASGMLELEQTATNEAHTTTAAHSIDPSLNAELVNNRLCSIATEMGQVLESVARSVNIRHRRDFSCAVFDARAKLLANAPHVPVHLGSMSQVVQSMLDQFGDTMAAGDAYVANTPDAGGTHLPDVTVVVPVFVDDTLTFFVAARGHHADFGGSTPGSMPALSQTLAEEGVILSPLRFARNGEVDTVVLTNALTDTPWPVRDLDTNIADILAQFSSCQRGSELISSWVVEHGWELIQQAIEYLLGTSAEAVTKTLKQLEGVSCVAPLENGSSIVINTSIKASDSGEKLVVDFTGASPHTNDNFNAPAAVVRAAVLYVLHLVLDDPDLPLNDGLMSMP